MKKVIPYFSVLSLLVLSFYLTVPVMAVDSPCGWSAIPMSDPKDDVWQATDPSKPWTGTLGNFRDEIDILNVTISGNSLQIEFEANVQIDINHQYTIYIDTNADGNSEYLIIGATGTIYFTLLRENDSKYWNGSDWTSALANFTIQTNNQYLQLPNLTLAIPNLASAKIAVVAAYAEQLTYYVDYAPIDPSGQGIPGYNMLLLLFGISMLLGIVLLTRKQESSI
ncbi:MAG: hypothetical protein ACTSYB_01145 [Candidatus Helarchaeota archaeon]